MLPIRWDPFRDMGRELGTLHREIDDIFRRTFGGGETALQETGAARTPLVNTFVRDNTLHVQAELPGIRKEDLDVSVEGNLLTIRGERKLTKETREEDFLVRESRYGSFLRKMTLPEGVNTEAVHASFDDGILEITMPMKKMVGGKKVTIEGPKKKEIH